MQPLKNYIKNKYNGSQSAFARAQTKPTSRQHVCEWIKHGGYYVEKIDGVIRLLIIKRNLD